MRDPSAVILLAWGAWSIVREILQRVRLQMRFCNVEETILKVDEFVGFESGREIANQRCKAKLIGNRHRGTYQDRQVLLPNGEGSGNHDPICWRAEGFNELEVL